METVALVQESGVLELKRLLADGSDGRSGVSTPIGVTLESDSRILAKDLTIEPILEIIRANGHKPDEALLRRTYNFAAEAHSTQTRNSGNPYILHPLAVASILADLDLDSTTIAAGLLHDVVEDTPRTLEDIRKEFGAEIANLVDGVTNVGRLQLQTREEHQSENVRRLLVATARDIRVIIIKLADRLHNMRTLRFLPLEKQIAISQSTLNIFAPLAHRMGIGRIKWELEDLALMYLEPDVYQMLKDRISFKLKDRQAYVERVRQIVGQELAKLKVPYQIFGRVKHFYSIWRKMQKQGLDFTEIFDLMAIRIITDTVANCYVVLGVIHSIYRQVEGRFKDYISAPKANDYRSLHTTVFGPENRMLEVQIRTWEMHRIAQQGVAAHWRYKESKDGKRLGDDVKWLRQLSTWLEETSNTDDLVDTLKTEIFADEIFCYTPKGDIVRLPADSTPIDFAYKIHTDLGDHIQGARIAGKFVSIDHPLRTGDHVEIITSRTANPKPDWLTAVKTSRAKTKIKRFLINSRRDELSRLGKSLLNRELLRERFEPEDVYKSDKLKEILTAHEYNEIDDLFVDIGFGRLQTRQVINALTRKKAKAPEPPPSRRRETIYSAELDGLVYRRALCCNPVPGEPTVGLVTKARGISIHRADCQNVVMWSGDPDRKIDIFWGTDQDQRVRVEIDIEAEDRVRLLGDVSNVISSTNTNIVASKTQTYAHKRAKIHFVLEVTDSSQLDSIIRRLEQVPGIKRVSRRRTPLGSKRV